MSDINSVIIEETIPPDEVVSVYRKPVGLSPVRESVSLDYLSQFSKFKYDDTHAILYLDKGKKYNFTMVSSVSLLPIPPQEAFSKAFFGECFIVSLQDDQIIDYVGDLVSFTSTFIIGDVPQVLDLPPVELKGYIKRVGSVPVITSVLSFIDSLSDEEKGEFPVGENYIIYSTKEEVIDSNKNFVLLSRELGEILTFYGTVAFVSKDEDGTYTEYKGKLKSFVRQLYID